MTIVFNNLANMTTSGSFNNLNMRIAFQSSILGAATGNQIRITFYWAGADVSTYVCGPVYVGQQGSTAPNFTGDQVAVTFSSSSTFHPPVTPGGPVVSDWITLAQNYDNTKNYVVAWFMGPAGGSNNAYFNNATTGCPFYTDNITGSSTASLTVPGANMTEYGANLDWCIGELEIGQASTVSVIALPRNIFLPQKNKYNHRT